MMEWLQLWEMRSGVELLWIAAAAVAIDWAVGDPRWLPHPVVWIGRWIGAAERVLRKPHLSDRALRTRGVLLTLSTVLLAGGAAWVAAATAYQVHMWAGYAAEVWLVSTTLAARGLRSAGMDVYRPLAAGLLDEARRMTGRIVGRDTERLEPREVARAAVETVAENIVDAFVSPLLFAALGGAPAAMLYRASNTLDSMVGYRNERYRYFGWASARWDDVCNYVPARLTGLLLVALAGVLPGYRGASAWRAWRTFAALHPSPNSGIPESAVAGALGIELGGTNVYGGIVSERARMGWPERELVPDDIRRTAVLLIGVSVLCAGVLLGCAAVWG